VANLIDGQTINVKVDTSGSYDGRIKVITMVVAYDDGDADQVYYWVNDGHDEDSTSYIGSSIFDLSALSGTIESATLTVNHMASSDANYWFNGNSIATDPATGNSQGSYFGYNIWDVTARISAGDENEFQYDGTWAYYKIPLATLEVRTSGTTRVPEFPTLAFPVLAIGAVVLTMYTYRRE
jgi:hypothetical protein